LWVPGNHDSPSVTAKMGGIPGVTVLGRKELQSGGATTVAAQMIDAYGLRILGVPDPRVWGDEGASGSGDDTVTNKLELKTMQAAVGDFDPAQVIDLGLTHEPVAADELEKLLKARAVASGHTHEQNPTNTIQSKGYISLTEGSTGLGGIHHYDSEPMEFSIVSVGKDCQYTVAVRYQNSDPRNADSGSSVSATTYYFKPQKIANAALRSCGVEQGIGPVQGVIPRTSPNVKADGSPK
jgi:hypothetical protein